DGAGRADLEGNRGSDEKARASGGCRWRRDADPPRSPGRLAVVRARRALLSRRHEPPDCFAVVVSLRSEEHTSELQSRSDLVCRRQPRPTLFPYTTLFRSDGAGRADLEGNRGSDEKARASGGCRWRRDADPPRSPGRLAVVRARRALLSRRHEPPDCFAVVVSL